MNSSIIDLLAVLRLGKDAYGVTVRQEIEARTGREVSIGDVYATLDRETFFQYYG